MRELGSLLEAVSSIRLFRQKLPQLIREIASLANLFTTFVPATADKRKSFIASYHTVITLLSYHYRFLRSVHI